jgi:hypothetical protein
MPPDPKPKKHKKKKRKKDEAYLDFIRGQACVICGHKAEPHHEPLKKGSGVGIKGSDRETIPLNRQYHTERHAIGKLTFAEKYNIDYEFEINRLQDLYEKKVD